MATPKWEEMEPVESGNAPDWNSMAPITQAESPSEPGLMDKILKGSQAARSTINVAKGVGDVVTGIPSFLSGLVNLPSNVSADVKSLWNDPGSFKRIASETGESVRHMLPYPETTRQLVTGNIPSEEIVSRESGQLLGSTLLPKVLGGGVKRGVRSGVKELPGAGVELQQIASEKAGQLAQSLEPGTAAVRAAYNQRAVTGGNPTIDVSPLRTLAETIKNHEKAASRPDTALIGQMEKIIESGETGWQMEHALSEWRRLGEQTREIKRTRGEVPRELIELQGQMRSIIENPQGINVISPPQPARPASTILGPTGQPAIPAQPARPAVTQPTPPTPQMQAGSTAWTDAQKLAHRQFSVEELIERVNKAAGVSGEGYRSYSPNSVIKWIEQQEKAATIGHPDNAARRFVQGFQPGELQTVKTKLRDMTKDMAALPTLRGTSVGSSQRALLAATGEGINQAIGGPFGQGATLGVIGGEAISRLMTTDVGRALVRRAMQIDPNVGPKFWATMAPGLQYGASQQDNSVQNLMRMLKPGSQP